MKKVDPDGLHPLLSTIMHHWIVNWWKHTKQRLIEQYGFTVGPDKGLIVNPWSFDKHSTSHKEMMKNNK